MTFFHRSFIVAVVSVSLAAAPGCGSTSSDGSGSNSQASTAPVTCATGYIHPRVCVAPSSVAGDEARDVNNDVNAPCPSGYTVSDDGGDGICCATPSATGITECAEPSVACGVSDCTASEEWAFEATSCSDATWAAANPSVCGDAAVDAAQQCETEAGKALFPSICASAATPIKVQWPAGVTGP
jgi:hypothetical protein